MQKEIVKIDGLVEAAERCSDELVSELHETLNGEYDRGAKCISYFLNNGDIANIKQYCFEAFKRGAEWNESRHKTNKD